MDQLLARSDGEGLTILVSSIVGIVGLAAVVRRARREYLSMSVVWVLAGSFMLIHFVGPLFRRYGGGDVEARASFVAAATAVGLAGGFFLVVGRLQSSCTGPTEQLVAVEEFLCGRGGRRLLVWLTAVGFLGVLLGLATLSGSISDALQAGRFELRGTGNPIVVVLAIQATRCLIVVAFMVPFVARDRTGLVRLIGASLVVVVAVGVFVVSKGARSLPIGVLGAYFLGAATIRSSRSTEGERRGFLSIVLVLVLLGWVTIGAYNARRLLSQGADKAASAFVALPFGEVFDFEVEPLDYHEVTVAAMQLDEGLPGQFLGPIRRIVFAPLPSGGIKPVDTNAAFAASLGFTDQRTIPPSIPGEGYVAVGGVGGAIIWGTLYGVLLGWLVRRTRRSLPLTLCVMATSFEIGLLAVRGQLYEVVVSIVALALILKLAVHLVGGSTASSASPGDQAGHLYRTTR